MKYAFVQRHRRVWPISVQCRVLQISMTGYHEHFVRKANCWDNACSETLFGSLKVERLHGRRFKTMREAKDETIDWLLWYNRARLHSTLAYVSPMQFEQEWLANQPRQANS